MLYTRSLSLIAATIIVFSGLVIQTTYANPGERGGERRGPPQEAIDACSGSAEGAACTFAGRRGENVEGTCVNPPRENAGMVCAPQDGRGRPDREAREDRETG